jgi:hypothetical protein
MDVLGVDQFGFRRGKGSREVIVMLSMVLERTLEIDEGLCSCFIDWQKILDHVKWTKLIQILQETGVDWHERRLIGELYIDHSAELQLDRGEMRSVQIGRVVGQE